ncbi:MAG: HAMP domain-containing protein, partial [Caldilineae bacterium]
MVLAVSAGFLLLFGTFLLLSERALQASADRLLEERLVIAQMTAAQLDILLQQGVAELVQARQLTEFNASNPDLSAEADMLVHTYSRLRLFAPGVLFLDPRGRVVLAHPPDLYPPGDDLSALPHVAVALAQRQVSISDPFQEPHAGRPVVAITVPLFNDEAFAGLLVGFFDLSAKEVIAPLEQAATLGHTGHAVLVDHRGRVLASTLPLPFLSPGEHLDFYRRALQNRQATIETTPFGLADVPGETQDELHVMAFAPLQTMPWGVSVGGDLDETFVGVQRLRRGMMALGIAALLVVGGTTLVSARRLVQPLQHLTQSARRIAGGELQTPLRLPAGGEIGELAAALEGMRHQLLTHIAEQERLNDTLERLVAAQGDELVRHHTILAGLDEVIQTPLGLKAMLSQILSRTLAASQLRQGAIFLCDEPSHALRPAVAEGLDEAQVDDLRPLATEAVARRA